ncbi:hypothetical protein J3R30DRAFT_3653625 [Lentinula aciculospora]|uniref:Uncharacterized protein n=1 Tax=Lentinula aciculospora TaxID=153920 RepID=A0A9W9AV07_9AGAR|nr:hypothetical protein J3R30DRAFT_3653625 [Lentinula aciculospora]
MSTHKGDDPKGIPNAKTIATLCNSPPDNLIGFNTSVWNCGCMKACLIRFNSNMRTVPGNLGDIVWGLRDTDKVCLSVSMSGVSPASRRTNVVFPVPFSPSMTMISESVKEPASTVSLNDPILSTITSSAFSTILKDNDSSRKRRFSVGMKPSKKILIPDFEVS